MALDQEVLRTDIRAGTGLNVPDPLSYRDRHSGIRVVDGTVLRTFDDDGSAWFTAAHGSGLLTELVAEGLVVEYEIEQREPLVTTSPLVNPISFPYEWTPSMLRDAGLLTLEIASRAWDAGFHIRDASAFNVVFSRGRPMFVDLGSFRPGHTRYFLAYGQFCDHFLNPLALVDSAGISQRMAWISLEGLTAEQTRRVAGITALRPRYLRHVWARAKLDRRSAGMDLSDRRSVRDDLGLSPDAIAKIFESLAKTLDSLELDLDGTWREYEETNTYDQAAEEIKREFIRSAASRAPGMMAVDVGANTGAYSQILADHFETVVAIEPDEATADALYHRVAEGELSRNILPMVIDIVDPPAGRGLMNLERPAALTRLRDADLVVWLAVIHHLVLTRNVHFSLLFDLAGQLSDRHVFEHVSLEDEMAQLLLSSRDEVPWPSDRASFEQELRRRFRIVDAIDVNQSRRLYEVVAL